MNDKNNFFDRANDLLDRLEKMLPRDSNSEIPDNAIALQWRHRERNSYIEPIKYSPNIRLSDLQCIDRQKSLIQQNTLQFIKALPANNVLLWGPRGTGKSSLVKAILNEYKNDGLRLVQVESQHLCELPEICDQLEDYNHRYIIFCDDLSFEANDPSYKSLKVILDGSIKSTPDNILIYATSNRRHLMPEYMSENQQSKIVDGELHLNEAIEEKLSLSERFGIWLSFHPFNQEQYLAIVDYWIQQLNSQASSPDDVHDDALRWALEHGSRSGRSAWQFARDWTGKNRLRQND